MKSDEMILHGSVPSWTPHRCSRRSWTGSDRLSSAAAIRNDAARARSDDWYRWLLRQYAALIAQLRPELKPAECDARAYSALTLCLGAWITLGRSRPRLIDSSVKELRATLLAAIIAIIGIELTR